MSSLVRGVLGSLLAIVMVIAPALFPGMSVSQTAYAANPTCSPASTNYSSSGITRRVLTFTTTTTCDWAVPAGVSSVDVLVVGGGGGGGGTGSRSGWSAGGGAGGSVATQTGISVTSGGTIPVIVGAGGIGGSSSSNTGVPTVGGDSSFNSSLSALGGGRGGHSSNTATASGNYYTSDGTEPTGGTRNGGGGSGQAYAQYGASGTPHSGGNGYGAADATQSAGGGAGAGANGVAGSAYYSGAGGAGATSSITGTSTSYGGGGGGGNRYASNSVGAGGAGGGGAGGKGGTAGTAGQNGFGGGGGGGGGGATSGGAASGGAGGSGVVIVSYVITPNAPTLTGLVGGANQATATYTVPSYTVEGNSITDVEYAYSSNSGSTWSSWQSFGETDGNSVVSGLTTGYTYLVHIRSVAGSLYSTTSSDMSVTLYHTQVVTWSPTNASVDVSAGAVTLSPAATALTAPTITYSVQTAGTPNCAIASSATPRVTFNAVGTCVIRATAAQTSTYTSATRDITLTVSALSSQTITFADLSDATYGDGTFTVTPTASSNLAVTVNSLTTGVCTVSSSTVTIVGVGTCSLQAVQAGDSSYSAATSVTKSMTVAPKPVTVSVAFANKPYDGNLSVAISGTPTLSGVLPADANYVGLDSSGITGSFSTATAASSKPVTVTFSSGALAAGTSGDRSSRYTITGYGSPVATIDKANQTVSFTSSIPATIYSADTYTPASTTTSGLAVTYSVTAGSSAICSISGGTVTMNAAGTCVVQADQAGNSNYNAAPTVQQLIIVSYRTQTISFANLASKTYGDGTFVVAPTASSSLAVTVVSLTTSVCSISSGTVSILDVGTCTLKATQAGDSSYGAATSVTKSMTVAPKPVTVSLAYADKQYDGNSRATLSGNPTLTGVLVADANYVSLDSSKMTGLFLTPSVGANKAISVTFGTGALAAGTSGDRSSRYSISGYGGPTAEITHATQAALTFTSPSYVIYGQSIPLVAVGGSSTGALSYARVSGPCSLANDVVTSYGAGNCVVTVTRAGDVNYSAQTSSTFTVTIGKANQTINFTSSVPATVTAGMTYSPTASSSAGLTVNYSIANGSNSVCSFSGGIVTLLSSGSCQIEASQSGNANYNAASTVTQSLTVGLINQSISFPAVSAKHFADPAFAAGATVSSGRAMAFASSTPSICSVDANTGMITPLLVGDCTIVVTSSGDTSYAVASPVSRTFSIQAIVAGKPSITSVSYGDSSVTLGIAAPSFDGGESVDGYQILATTGNSTITAPFCVFGSPCTVNGLTNGETYTFTASAINGAGVGPTSDSSPSIIPVSTPEAVSALTTTPGDQTLAISWAPLTSSQLGGATFTRYDVSIRERGASWSSPVSVSGQNQLGTRTTSSYIFTGLLNGQAYDVQIVAITSANGQAIQSNTTTALGVPATVPSSPMNLHLTLISGTELVASWSPPTSDGGATVSSYEVDSAVSLASVIPGNISFFVGLTNPTCAFANASDTFCTVSGLTAGQNVSVSVGATNLLGTGTAATAAVTVPGGTVPVSNIVSTPTSSTQNNSKNSQWGRIVSSVTAEATAPIHVEASPSAKQLTQETEKVIASDTASNQGAEGMALVFKVLAVTVGTVCFFILLLWFLFARKRRKQES